FDPGSIDGIFGEATAVALGDFQRNSGLFPDSILGPGTLTELNRYAMRPAGEDLVSNVRERVRAAARPASLSGRSIAIGEEGGFSVGVRATCRALSAVGALPLPLHHPEQSHQAAEANLAGVDCYVGIRLNATHASVLTCYYRGYRYESWASRSLAELIGSELVAALALADGGSEGMALPILRETRMPAVVLELGAPRQVVVMTAVMAAAIVRSLECWMRLEQQAE
ncbi:MAG: peptidoglycan-binding protein, partial [Acidimicrobiales bacterium]